MSRRRRRFEAARRERMRDAQDAPDPLHVFSPRVLLILGGIFTLFAVGFSAAIIDEIWVGVTVFGMLAIATGAAVAGLKATGKLSDKRATERWIEADDDLVHAEKVEQLGHTMGGLSEATDAQAGQLSEMGPD